MNKIKMIFTILDSIDPSYLNLIIFRVSTINLEIYNEYFTGTLKDFDVKPKSTHKVINLLYVLIFCIYESNESANYLLRSLKIILKDLKKINDDIDEMKSNYIKLTHENEKLKSMLNASITDI